MLLYRKYTIDLVFNGSHWDEVWIDPHYGIKHSAAITDELILTLVQEIDGELMQKCSQSKGYNFYEVDVDYMDKLYRLILVTPPDNRYLGIRNAYRRSK